MASGVKYSNQQQMRVAIIGYGKLGAAVAEVAANNGWTVVARVNKGDEWTASGLGADIVFESSTPQHAVNNALKCIAANLPVVIGTTGWPDRMDELKEAGGTVFHATNFSIGVHLLNEMSAYMTRAMKKFPEYSAQIKDVHHIHKLDAPSGTALTLRDVVRANGGDATIDSVREGEIVGIHELLWNSEVDVLALRHEATSRKGFALGAYQALLWLSERHAKGAHGIYNMNDLISKIQ
jgi:4-hydroxy-tetrahydrodipicolinate reductase